MGRARNDEIKFSFAFSTVSKNVPESFSSANENFSAHSLASSHASNANPGGSQLIERQTDRMLTDLLAKEQNDLAKWSLLTPENPWFESGYQQVLFRAFIYC